MINILIRFSAIIFSIGLVVDLSFLARLGLLGISTGGFPLIKIALGMFFCISLVKSITCGKIIGNVFIAYSLVFSLLGLILVLGFDASSLPYSKWTRYWYQLFAFWCAISTGYYLSKVVLCDHELLETVLKLSLFIMLCGCFFQLAFIGFSGLSVPRLFGISGEPKALSIIISAFLLAYITTRNVLVSYKSLALTFLLMIFLLLTKSSTGLIGLLIGFFVFNNSGLKSLVKLIFILLMLYTIGDVSGLSEHFINRVSNRLSGDAVAGIEQSINLPLFGSIVFDGNDIPFIRMIFDNYAVIIFGSGPGVNSIYANEYIVGGETGFIGSDYVGYLVPNFAVLSHLTSFGLIGFIVIMLSYHRMYKHIINSGLFYDRLFSLNFFYFLGCVSLYVYEGMLKFFIFYSLVYFLYRKARS